MILRRKQYVTLIFCLVVTFIMLVSCGSDEPEPNVSPTVASEPTQPAAPTATAIPVEPTHTSHAPATVEVAETPTEVVTEAAKSEVMEISIDMHDSYYGDADTNMTEPPTWNAITGKPLILNLTNHGQENHNWAIVKAGSEVPIPFDEGRASEIILLEPGMVYSNSQTQWVIFAPEPGEYEIICTVAGHYPFMRGKLIVTK